MSLIIIIAAILFLVFIHLIISIAIKFKRGKIIANKIDIYIHYINIHKIDNNNPVLSSLIMEEIFVFTKEIKERDKFLFNILIFSTISLMVFIFGLGTFFILTKQATLLAALATLAAFVKPQLDRLNLEKDKIEDKKNKCHERFYQLYLLACRKEEIEKLPEDERKEARRELGIIINEIIKKYWLN